MKHDNERLKEKMKREKYGHLVMPNNSLHLDFTTLAFEEVSRAQKDDLFRRGFDLLNDKTASQTVHTMMPLLGKNNFFLRKERELGSVSWVC